jgi:sec-independent protein translocase protein TatA
MWGISTTQLVIILVIVVLIFGTKRLPSAARDLGSAITSFRKGMKKESSEDTNDEIANDKNKS